MNWEILGYIFGGIFGCIVIGFIIALVEEEWKAHKRRKEEKAYQEKSTCS